MLTTLDDFERLYSLNLHTKSTIHSHIFSSSVQFPISAGIEPAKLFRPIPLHTEDSFINKEA